MSTTTPETPPVETPPEVVDEKPPWGDEFDAEKAWSLVQNLRADKEKLQKQPRLTAEQQAKLDEYERQEQAAKSELEKKGEELTRWQSEAEKWRSSAVTHRIEALAATADFADPSDAVGQLDPASYLDAGGQIDEDAIKADLAKILEKKPHWRRQEKSSAPRVPAPNPAQGSGGRTTTADPAQEFAQIVQSRLK